MTRPSEVSNATRDGAGRWGGLLAALVVFGWLASTEPALPIVWDEGYTLGRIERVRSWCRALVDPPAFARSFAPPRLELVQADGAPPAGRAKVETPTRDRLDTRGELFSPEVLLYFWPFAREEPHGHPPFYAIVGLLGDVVTPWRAPLGRARFGTMLAYSLVAGWVFGFLDRRRGRWAALAAVGGLALQPRLFAHAHYAIYDGLLTAQWLGAVLAFALAVEEGTSRPGGPRWGWAAAFGLILGTAMATKVTGWFMPLPFLAWTVLCRDRRGFLTLGVGGLIALVACYVLVPPWWLDPLDGFQRFVASNLGRARSIPIATMFLSRVYVTPGQSLPWYNTLVLTLFVAPIGILALSLAGVVSVLRRFWIDRFGVLVIGNWLFVLLLRSMPHVPGHDGERLFLPAFGMLAIAAGLGAGAIAARSGRAARWIVGLALAEGLLSVAVVLPVPLSYFSPAVGGTRGAAALGMEPTYYWSALTPEALDWLNEHTPAGQKVRFDSFPTTLVYLRQTGGLRPGHFPGEPGMFVWYVLQNRSGSHTAAQRSLIATTEPSFIYEKQGVPLLWIFPYEAYARAEAMSRAGRGRP